MISPLWLRNGVQLPAHPRDALILHDGSDIPGITLNLLIAGRDERSPSSPRTSERFVDDKNSSCPS